MNNRGVHPFRKTLVSLLALFFAILGAGAAVEMDVQSFPDQSLPAYTIRVLVPGMIPERVDEEVTRPAEEAVRELGAVEKIISASRTGASEVHVRIKQELDTDYEERLSAKLEALSQRVPGASVTVEPHRLKANEIGYFLLHGTDLQTLSDIARYTIYEKLVNLPGVSRVEIEGESVQNKVEVLFRPSMLQLYAITPGDIVRQLQGEAQIHQVGTAGEGNDETGFQWEGQAANPQELGKRLVSTGKGYVAVKVLAEIRDLRGTKGEAVPVYQGEPSVGIRVFGQETGNITSVRAQVAEAVAALNQASQGRYTLDWFTDRQAVLSGTLRDLATLVALAAGISSVLLGLQTGKVSIAVASLLSAVLAVGAVLGGMWISGMPLTLASLGPATLFALFFIGAGTALFNRLGSVEDPSIETFDREVKRLFPSLLLSLAVCSILFAGVLYTDVLKETDKPLLCDALPVMGWGTLSLLLVYGLIAPTLTAMWWTEPKLRRKRKTDGAVTRYLAGKWEDAVSQGYLPYGTALTLSLLAVLFLHSFVLVDTYDNTDRNQMTVSLPMMPGSSVEDAVQAAAQAEQQLRTVAEVQDLYAVATKQELTFHVRLQDKYDWTRSRADLEKELDKQLRGIPGTDPYALVVGENRSLRMEFTVKGPSLHTTREIANHLFSFLRGLHWQDDEGREIITDEKTNATDHSTQISIKPRPEMLARYQVTEDDVKNQLAQYLGEQRAGSAYWNDRTVPIVARYPEHLLAHADQVRGLLIRTPKGTVRLADLVDWQIGTAPPIYQREDGLYVFQVSSAVSEPSRIESLYYVLPLRMKQSMTIPEGYRILNEDERKKQQEEEANRTDWTLRLIVTAVVIVGVLLASVLLVRRIRDGAFVLLLLPTLSGAVLLGLLVFDRPLNLMGFYGIAAALALLVQQVLVKLDALARARQSSATIEEGVRLAAASSVHSVSGLYAALLAACLPLAASAVAGIDVHASFATSLLAGCLLGWFAVTVLVPAMYREAERKQAYSSDVTLPILIKRLGIWWQNQQVRRQDVRERKKRETQRKRAAQDSNAVSSQLQSRELSPEDFLPLSTVHHKMDERSRK